MTGDLPRPWRVSADRWSEPLDDLMNGGPDLDEIEDGHRSFPIAERYLQQKAWLHLHLRARPAGRSEHSLDRKIEPHDLCGIIIAALKGHTNNVGPRGSEVHGLREPEESADKTRDLQPLTDVEIVEAHSERAPSGKTEEERPSRMSTAKRNVRSAREGRVDVPMLVHIIEVGEHGERVPVPDVLSEVVRLTPLDECEVFVLYAGSKPSTLRRSLPRSFELGTVVIDRELVIAGRAVSPRDRELPERVVQGRAKGVGKLSDRQTKGQRRWSARYAVDVIAGVSIEVSDYAVSLAVQKDGPLAIEECQALVCTTQSEIDAFEAGLHAR